MLTNLQMQTRANSDYRWTLNIGSTILSSSLVEGLSYADS